MKQLIDIHCHILPDVDDGAKDEEITRKMLELAAAEGIKIIVATPHYHYQKATVSPHELGKKLQRVREIAKEIDPSMRIFLGTEIYAAEDIERHLQKRHIVTMAKSKYVLVEFSPQVDGMVIRSTFYKLLLAGYFPILAHVERYRDMVKNLEHVRDLIELGGYIQCNCSTIVGKNGIRAKWFAKQLLEEGLVHFIGTDAHGVGKRAPEMKKCVNYIAKHYGNRYAYELSYENPKKMIKNMML